MLFTRFYAIAGWIFDRVESFPKLARFTVGERVIGATVDVLEGIVMAQYATEKRALLVEANLRLQALRVLLRLCMERKHLSFRQYEHVSGELEHCGRMLGGWIRGKVKTKAKAKAKA